jgi:lipoprotein NlpD
VSASRLAARHQEFLPMRHSPIPRSGLSQVLRRGGIALLTIVLVACASRTRAPVEDRTALPAPRSASASATMPAPAPGSPPEAESRGATYTVKRGDTLYQIALDLGLDYKDLAAWNNLDNPNKILTGQVLRVTAPGDAATGTGVTTAPLKAAPAVAETRPGAAAGAPPPATSSPVPAARNADNYKSSPKAFKEPYSEQALRDVARASQAPPEVVAAAPTSAAKPEPPRSVSSTATPASAAEPDDEDKLDWVWPAKGKVVVGFSETANLKGIDIAGAAGEPVIASAGGKVVYVGNGLRGYGKLVIVKHNKTWLSAYAHNQEILVKEGQQVVKGQKIAEMGNTDADQVKLHFEIRRLGKPVDPARYLPAG